MAPSLPPLRATHARDTQQDALLPSVRLRHQQHPIRSPPPTLVSTDRTSCSSYDGGFPSSSTTSRARSNETVQYSHECETPMTRTINPTPCSVYTCSFTSPTKHHAFPASSRSSISSDACTDVSAEFDDVVAKKARRKEQCRVNQANYRKRKRMHETQIRGQIRTLEDEILELAARKATLEQRHRVTISPSSSSDHRGHDEPIASIRNFYYALESARLDSPPSAQLHYPVLYSLFDRQQQEFASIEGLRLQWLWYREHFDVFKLFVSSSERLDAGDQAIIRISAQLHIQMQRKAEDAAWRARILVCPVLQQFEFHACERVLTRITSEIDWIAGVAALVQHQPEPTLTILKELAERVSGVVDV